jgi:LPS-assembly lipoprotein
MVLGVGACGFRPLNHPRLEGGAVGQGLQNIRIEFVENRIGQELRNQLLDRLNPYGQPDRALYSLTIELVEGVQNLGIRKDDSSTRANLIINARYQLSDLQARKELTRGSFRSVNSYDILTSQYATQIAREDARRRGAEQIANHIETRLSLYFLEQAQRRRAGQ